MSLTSSTIKTAFAAAGFAVRVKSFGHKFRICRVGEVAHTPETAAVAASLGLTDTSGVGGFNINSPYEAFAYAPGSVRILRPAR